MSILYENEVPVKPSEKAKSALALVVDSAKESGLSPWRVAALDDGGIAVNMRHGATGMTIEIDNDGECAYLIERPDSPSVIRDFRPSEFESVLAQLRATFPLP